MGLRAWAVAAVTFGAIACTSFGDGADPASTTDGGATANVDASSSDGGASRDAGADFCATLSPSPTLCVDFEDHVVPANAPWIAAATGGATATLIEQNDCGIKASRECLELAGTKAEGTLVDVGAGLRRRMSGPARNVSAALNVRVTDISGGVWDALSVAMGKNGGATFWVLEVELDDLGNVTLSEYLFAGGAKTYENKRASAIKVPKAEWHRVSLDITVGGTASRASLAIDGKAAVDKDVLAHEQTEFYQVDFGDVQADTGLTWKVRIDDLTATYAPK